jgi:hypothetical protein
MIAFGVIVTIMHAVVIAISVTIGFTLGAIFMNHLCIIRWNMWDDDE